MPSTSRTRWALSLAAFVLSTVVLTVAAERTIPPEKVSPDFIQFWTAANLLRDGQDPYDPVNQARIQGGLGWEREKDGYGVYDFLPYYYPPWLGLAFLPFLALGYGLAKLAWLVLGAEMIALSAILLRRSVAGVPPALVAVVAVFFAFSLKAVAMGQVAPLVLLLLAAAWRLLEARRDAAAGCVLALLSIKPQLTVILIAALLGWTASRGRWRVWHGFAAMLVLLCLVSTVVFPAWLPSMLAATRETPMPTAYYPGLGATWYVALQAVGIDGALLHLAVAAVAVPILLMLFRMTLRSETEASDLFALALVAPFFIAPYARPYDFPVLLIPVLTLMGKLPDVSRVSLAIAMTLLPALHLLHLTASYVPPVVGVRRPEFTYFWIPMLVGLVWLLCCGSKKRREGLPHRPANPG